MQSQVSAGSRQAGRICKQSAAIIEGVPVPSACPDEAETRDIEL